MFQLSCPVCSTQSTNKFFYASGQFFCSESCFLQSQRTHQFTPTPIVIPFPQCEMCQTLIEDVIPEFYDRCFFCSTYCKDEYMELHSIKSF